MARSTVTTLHDFVSSQSTMDRNSILISGWRFLPHSYAIVNQFQCLELMRRPGIELFFEDRPLYSRAWESIRGLLPTDDESAIASLTDLPPGEMADAELRITYPYDLESIGRGRRLFVFGTAEYKGVPNGYLKGGVPIADALTERPDVQIITPSAWSRGGFLAAGAGADRVFVVPHGVDPQIHRPPTANERISARDASGLAEDEFTFLAIGAMTGSKNPDLTLKAFAAVLRDHPRAVLILKGMDALYDSYEMFKAALAAALPGPELGLVLPRVRYVGKSLTVSEVAQLYHAADCYVTPYSAEGFNLPALEAAACGLPVIATSGGPTDEFLTDEFALRIRSVDEMFSLDGKLLAGLAPEAQHLEELMKNVVTDTGFRSTAAAAGPKFVHANFTWKHAVDKLLSVIFP